VSGLAGLGDVEVVEAVHSVEGAEPVKLDAPYPIRIAPAAWL
jgi:hypothetical protein